jgi:hypothetical protein
MRERDSDGMVVVAREAAAWDIGERHNLYDGGFFNAIDLLCGRICVFVRLFLGARGRSVGCLRFARVFCGVCGGEFVVNFL